MQSATPAAPGLGDRLAEADRSVLAVIDLQEPYRGKLHQEDRVIAATVRLLQAASTLGVPVVVAEQYPERFGGSLPEITEVLGPDAVTFPKRTFSCAGAEGFLEHLRELGREQVVIAGIEAHVCVSQTAHDLMAEGYQVHAVRDAITSRFELESTLGFEKMVGSGAVPATVEGVLFEWLHDSRSPHFKAVHRLVV